MRIERFEASLGCTLRPHHQTETDNRQSWLRCKQTLKWMAPQKNNIQVSRDVYVGLHLSILGKDG